MENKLHFYILLIIGIGLITASYLIKDSSYLTIFGVMALGGCIMLYSSVFKTKS